MDIRDTITMLGKRGSIPGLDAIRSLLKELGNPQNEVTVIHVAGTNGKGSVSSFLQSILIEGGLTVGRFLSPVVECYEEKFQINGRFISEEELEFLLERVLDADRRMARRGERLATLFEIETALAFEWFSRRKVDVMLLECGMGGRDDATNVVEHPLLSIITSISRDHMQFLGESIQEIASHKAGIIKGGCPVILAENSRAVRDTVIREAEKRNAPLTIVSEKDYRILEERYDGNQFEYRGVSYEINLPGRHQISNAVTALCAASLLSLPIDNIECACRQGLAKTSWPGRLEIISREPLTYRDGAHNAGGARALAAFAEKHFTNRRIIYIIGILSDKEVEEMVKALLPSSDFFYVFTPSNSRGLQADRLASIIRSCGKEAVICEDVNDGLKQARAFAKADDVLIVCGSLSFMEEMSS